MIIDDLHRIIIIQSSILPNLEFPNTEMIDVLEIINLPCDTESKI